MPNRGRVGAEQMALDIMLHEPTPERSSTYWENRGPRDWHPVLVTLRYGNTSGHPEPVFPHVVAKKLGPRNVLIQRADGTRDVVPVRNLRRRPPA